MQKDLESRPEDPRLTKRLTPDIVRTEVERYWAAFVKKDGPALNDFYAHESIGFSSTSKRSEPGRMAAIRREREYFGSGGKIESEIDAVEVVMLGETVAIATYTFRFRATRSSGLGKLIEEDIQDGRATQVFGFDSDGRVRIFHEHFSQPMV